MDEVLLVNIKVLKIFWQNKGFQYDMSAIFKRLYTPFWRFNKKINLIIIIINYYVR